MNTDKRNVERISVFGSTGSVGQATLDVIASDPERFAVGALVAGRNVDALAAQAHSVRPALAVIAEESLYESLRTALAGSGIACAAGREAVLEAATIPAERIVMAIGGMAGLAPLMAALEATDATDGRIVAIANKEPLVSAGALVLESARRHGATILPLDSEHNAIFQVFDHERPEGIVRILLTASGGPFLNVHQKTLENVTPDQALRHPNWRMGAKISIDSATMMNKALELIEAQRLFGLPEEKITVLIHPQSIVHSMVEYRDGSVLAQMGAPDMRTPIAYALAWPERMKTPGTRLDLCGQTLTFADVDTLQFPAIDMARSCLRSGDAACVVMNAANEVAVGAFLAGRISFPEITRAVSRALDRAAETDWAGYGCSDLIHLDDVVSLDQKVRTSVQSAIVGG